MVTISDKAAICASSSFRHARIMATPCEHGRFEPDEASGALRYLPPANAYSGQPLCVVVRGSDKALVLDYCSVISGSRGRCTGASPSVWIVCSCASRPTIVPSSTSISPST